VFLWKIASIFTWYFSTTFLVCFTMFSPIFCSPFYYFQNLVVRCDAPSSSLWTQLRVQRWRQ
jgi:hypothetical protein